MDFKLTTALVLLVLNPSLSLKLNELCGNETFIDISDGTRFTNGDVYFEGVKYDKSEYYIDNVTGVAKGCLCTKKKCVRKCCPFGQGYNAKTKVCENVTDVFSPPVWDEYRLMKSANATQMFTFNFGKINCSEDETRIRIGQASDAIHLISDGKLFIEMPGLIPPWMVYGPDKYCIDTFVLADELGNRRTQLDALVCFVEQTFDSTSYYISSTCMLISCVFILATVGVYAWLPELRNLHGRVLMAYLCCLFVGFLFFAIMQILLVKENISVNCCLVFTFVIYFSLLSGFFWLNVMSFDIWWTFSGKRGTSLEKLSCRARFCAYATYAFGVPTALTAVLAGLEFSGLPRHALLPNIRHQGCFIFGNSKLMYFYSPIAILCIANSVFFILTAVRIASIKRQTAVLQSKESATHDQHSNDRQRLLLYVKLFAVMGINWILEVISGMYPDATAVWSRYTDAYNVLIGLIIFIIFVCKRKIFRLIKKRYRQLRGDALSRTQTSSSRTVSTNNYDMRMSNIKSNGHSTTASTSMAANCKVAANANVAANSLVVNSNTEEKSNMAANINSVSNTNTEANSNMAANINSVSNTNTEANSNMAANLNLVSNTNTEANSNMAANFNSVSNTNTEANSNMAANFNSVSNTNTEANSNMAANFNSVSNTNTEANSNMAANFNSVSNTNTEEKSNVSNSSTPANSDLVVKSNLVESSISLSPPKSNSPT